MTPAVLLSSTGVIRVVKVGYLSIDLGSASSQPNSAGSMRVEDARSVLMNTIRQSPTGAHFSRATVKVAETLVLEKQAWR